MMKGWVRQPGVSQRLRGAHPPSEVRSNAATVKIKSLDVSPLAAERVVLTLCSLPAAWRWNLWPPQTCPQTPAHQSSTCRPECCSGSGCRRHQGTDRDHSDWRGNQLFNIVQCWPWDARSHVYSQHVSNDAEAPHVCVEGHKIVVDDLRSKKLWGAKIDPELLPGFIPVAGDTVNTFCLITSGNGIGQRNRTYTLARPKSMILILFVTLFTQRMFSGWSSPQKKIAEKSVTLCFWTFWEAAVWCTTDLEVQVQDVHLVHVLQAFNDLPDEGDGIKFHQSVVLINDPVKQFTAANTRVGDRCMKLGITLTNKADIYQINYIFYIYKTLTLATYFGHNILLYG